MTVFIGIDFWLLVVVGVTATHSVNIERICFYEINNEQTVKVTIQW